MHDLKDVILGFLIFLLGSICFFCKFIDAGTFFGFEKTHFLKSLFYRSRWKSKTPVVPDSYKRCTLLLELKTCCANLKPFTITLRLLGQAPIYSLNPNFPIFKIVFSVKFVLWTVHKFCIRTHPSEMTKKLLLSLLRKNKNWCCIALRLFAKTTALSYC